MIAKNMGMLREKYNFTQAQIASYLNITPAEVDQFENDARSVPADVVSKLAVLFNVDEYDLYEIDPQQQSIFPAIELQANKLTEKDIKSISDFRKIVTNYIHLSKALANE